MREVVILSSVRTAGGAFGGSLKSLSVVDLGVHAAKEAIRRSGVTPEHFDEAVIGNGWQAGVGPNSARVITVGAGLTVTTTTLPQANIRREFPPEILSSEEATFVLVARWNDAAQQKRFHLHHIRSANREIDAEPIPGFLVAIPKVFVQAA